MLTLAAAETLAGVAQTAAKVTCTIYGDEVTVATGASAYKTLNQQQLPAAAATIYGPVGAGLISLVKSIHVVNTDTVNTNTFQLFSGGTAQANAITPSITIPAGGLALYAADGWKVFNSAGQLQGQGATGAAGSPGPNIWIPSFDDPGSPEDIVFPKYQSEKNMVYLGTKTGTGVTVGPLTWLELFDLIYWEYQIGGYNGGTPVGRMLCGNGAPSTTALSNGNGLNENGVNNATSINVPGCPLAVTLSAIGRSGWGYIRGASGALKQIDIRGQSGNPAAGTSPTVFDARSFFNEASNLPIRQIQLSVYDTLIATAVSAQTFVATTFIRAWGIRKNP